jgi:hypothetical protein
MDRVVDLVYGAPVTKGEGVRDQHRPDQIQRCTSPTRDGAAAVTLKAGGAQRRLAGASLEMVARGYMAPFATWFEHGEREGRRGAHQRLVDGGGAV